MILYNKSKSVRKFQLAGPFPIPEQSTMRATEKQGIVPKTADVITHPFTALGQYMNHGYVPDNFGSAVDKGVMEASPYDLPASTVNPVEEVADVGGNVIKGNYGTAAATAAMFFVPSIIRKSIIDKIKPYVKKVLKTDALDMSSAVSDGTKQFAAEVGQEVPTSPGILVQNYNKKFKKEVLDKQLPIALPPRPQTGFYYTPNEHHAKVNNMANKMRKKGAGLESYDVAEAIGNTAQSGDIIPSSVYRGVKIPMTEAGLGMLNNRRVINYAQVPSKEIMTNNAGMLKMRDYAIDPDMKRIQGIDGGNIGNSNYMHGNVWTGTKDVAKLYSSTGKKLDGPQGMIQKFEVDKSKPLFGVADASIYELQEVMSKVLNKKKTDITLKESENLLRKWGIDFFSSKGFRGTPEYHFLPGKIKATTSKLVYKKGGIFYQKFQKGKKINMWNPKNWGVEDLSEHATFGKAYENARLQDLDEFIWGGQRYNTKNSGADMQQVGMYGNTDSLKSPAVKILSSAADQSAYYSAFPVWHKGIEYPGPSINAKTYLKRLLNISAMTGHPSIERLTEGRLYDDSRSSYTSPGNKIKISTDFDLIPEYAHAYRNENEESEAISMIKSWFKKPYFTYEGQQENYTAPGQAEFDAHTKVEPALTDYYEGIIKKEDIPGQIKLNREHNFIPKDYNDY